MEENTPKYLPGFEPEEIKSLTDSFFTVIDKTFPDKVIIRNEWNHQAWDNAANLLCKKLGYSNGKDFLEAYGYRIVDDKSNAVAELASVQLPSSDALPEAANCFISEEHQKNIKTLKKHSKKWPIIMALLLITFAGIAAFFYFKNGSLNTDKKSSSYATKQNVIDSVGLDSETSMPLSPDETIIFLNTLLPHLTDFMDEFAEMLDFYDEKIGTASANEMKKYEAIFAEQERILQNDIDYLTNNVPNEYFNNSWNNYKNFILDFIPATKNMQQLDSNNDGIYDWSEITFKVIGAREIILSKADKMNQIISDCLDDEERMRSAIESSSLSPIEQARNEVVNRFRNESDILGTSKFIEDTYKQYPDDEVISNIYYYCIAKEEYDMYLEFSNNEGYLTTAKEYAAKIDPNYKGDFSEEMHNFVEKMLPSDNYGQVHATAVTQEQKYNSLSNSEKKAIGDYIQSRYDYYDKKAGGYTGDKYSDTIMQEAADKYGLSVSQVNIIWMNYYSY